MKPINTLERIVANPKDRGSNISAPCAPSGPAAHRTLPDRRHSPSGESRSRERSVRIGLLCAIGVVQHLRTTARARRRSGDRNRLRSLSRDHSRRRSAGLGAVMRQRWTPLDSLHRRDGLWLAVESIDSPGNLGTMLRTAEAAGANGVIVIGGPVRPRRDPRDDGSDLRAEARTRHDRRVRAGLIPTMSRSWVRHQPAFSTTVRFATAGPPRSRWAARNAGSHRT